MDTEIAFFAEHVETQNQEYTPDFIVVGIYFSENDELESGQHWNFTRGISSDENETELVEMTKKVFQDDESLLIM